MRSVAQVGLSGAVVMCKIRKVVNMSKAACLNSVVCSGEPANVTMFFSSNSWLYSTSYVIYYL